MNKEDMTPEMMQQVEGTSRELSNALRGNIKGKCVPKPPRKGELIRCQQCGDVMLPEHFSKNPNVRKREFKWQMHFFCQQSLLDMCDRETTGLSTERSQAEKRKAEMNR